LTSGPKLGMHHAMFEPQNKWPISPGFMHPIAQYAQAVMIFVLLAMLDAPVTMGVANLPDWVRDPFYTITRPGNSDWILYPTLLGSIIGGISIKWLLSKDPWLTRVRTLTSISLFIFIGVGLPGLIANIIKRALGRARPVNFDQYGIFHFEPLHDWTFQSFPSGDTTTMFALAAVVAFFLPGLKWWALFGAAMVGLARIMIGMHFPTDVFGGILLGTLGAFAIRNYCAKRGWIFTINEQGAYVPKLNWPT
jgi:membrane-associated phospholipid phosphatase